MKMQCGGIYLVHLVCTVQSVASHPVVRREKLPDHGSLMSGSESGGENPSLLSSVAPPTVAGRLPAKKLSAHIASLLDSISHCDAHTVIP